MVGTLRYHLLLFHLRRDGGDESAPSCTVPTRPNQNKTNQNKTHKTKSNQIEPFDQTSELEYSVNKLFRDRVVVACGPWLLALRQRALRACRWRLPVLHA